MAGNSNPYISERPVGGSRAFVGRSDILGEALRLLNSTEDRAMCLCGQRRIGKTSLLQHLKVNLPRKGPYLPVYFDLQGIAGRSLDQVLARLTGQMLNTLGLRELIRPDRISPTAFQHQILPRIVSGLPRKALLVLLFDEFDTLPPGAHTQAGTAFYPCLRQIIRHAPQQIRFIFAIGRHSRDPEEIRNTFFQGVPHHEVALLSSEETAELVRLSERDNTLRWPDAQVEAVREFTGGHPYLTQNLCRIVWEESRRKGNGQVPVVHFKDMGQNFSKAIRSASAAFEWLWDGFGPWERVMASALAETGSQGLHREKLHEKLRQAGVCPLNGGPEDAIGILEQWGIIRAEADAYRIGISMLSRWIIAARPFEDIRDELDRMAAALFSRACTLCREEQMDGAIGLLQQTVSLSPDHLKANRLLAKLLIRQGRIDEALGFLEPLYEFSFPELRPLYIRALLYKARHMEDGTDQLALYEKVLDIEPDQPHALAGCRAVFEEQGDRAYEAGEFDAALALYTRAEARDKTAAVEQALEQIALAKELKRRKKKGGIGRKALRWAGVFLLFVSCGLFAVYALYRHVSEDLPRISSLRDYRPPVVTTVYADDGQKIAEFYREYRFVVPLSQMSETLIQAFISAEDARFFSHEGVDFFSIVRAFLKNMEAGTVVQGGSTITQQVIKSFLLTPERSYERKLKEAILAYRIDRAFTKEDILFLYLNQIYLGNGAYGVEAAARNYFGKSAKSLSLSECALLAGLAKAPSGHSPVRYFDKARVRQEYVLNRMAEEGYITPEQARKAFDTPLSFKPRQNLYREKVPFFAEYVRGYIEKTYGFDALYNQGLTVYTTVDPAMQAIARKQVEKGVAALEKRHRYPGNLRPQGALLCVETGTGYVRAMVGGRDFETSQFNRAVQSRRQPGSAFKPVIYAAALDKGYTPMTLLYDSPIVIPDNGKLWKPHNYDNKFYGPIRLRRALAKSRNLPVIKVLRNIGIGYAIDYARNLGITSRLNKGLSMALGASGISLFEMVQAYSVFANQGQRVEPVFIRKITDRYGSPVHMMRTEPEQAIDKSTAFLMTSLLQSVVTNGTGYKVKALGRPTAGKTGTTNDFRDAWFIGYTPGYVTGAWVGFDIERPLGRSETGSKAASPIWLGFMQEILRERPVQEFSVPEGVVYAKIDAATGLLATSDSPRAVEEWFREGTQPKRYAPRPEPVPIITEPEDFFKAGL